MKSSELPLAFCPPQGMQGLRPGAGNGNEGHVEHVSPARGQEAVLGPSSYELASSQYDYHLPFGSSRIQPGVLTQGTLN